MIKWFDTKIMKNLPVIANTQGELVAMLNTLLVNGFNSRPISSVGYANGVCTLTVGADHGFVRHSVINIQGSAQAVFADSEFRITSITPTAISFKSAPVNQEVGLTVRYAPLGYTAHFKSEGRACYKSKNPMYKAYLRVDDTKLAGTEPQAAKFATVEICEDMSDFNTVIGSQSPYIAEYPLQNRQTIAGRSNGWFKWYYSAAYGTDALETGTLAVQRPAGDSKNYMLIGDDLGFYLVTYPNTNAAVIYGFYHTDNNSHLIANNGFVESRYEIKNMISGYSYGVCSLYGLQGLESDGTNYITAINPLTSSSLPCSYGQVFFKNIVMKSTVYNIIYKSMPRIFVSETSMIDSSTIYSGNERKFLSFKEATTAILFEVT